MFTIISYKWISKEANTSHDILNNQPELFSSFKLKVIDPNGETSGLFAVKFTIRDLQRTNSDTNGKITRHTQHKSQLNRMPAFIWASFYEEKVGITGIFWIEVLLKLEPSAIY